MTTNKPRINVTFEEDTVEILEYLAKKEKKSVAGLVRELVVEALDVREDLYFSQLAERIDRESTKTYSHEEAWK